jgi:2-succinyl-5-enolpyruvyl-6-hydroxy-3-cyclohexene-1-carboxylate synthase
VGYPVLADPLSGVRFGAWVGDGADDGVISTAYESFLTQNQDPPLPAPQIIIRFGQVPTSKWLNSYLSRQITAVRLHIRENGVWADDTHQTTHFWQCAVAGADGLLAQSVPTRLTSDWLAGWQGVEQAAWDKTEAYLAEHFFDATAVSLLLQTLPPHTNLLIGNSLPIRHVDQFGRAQGKPLTLFGNRGASGIDGTISTAVGIASLDPSRPTVLLVGDVTFYHDLNGLLALRQNNIQNLSILLLNNGGGGIFNRLPVATYEPAFTPLFRTPHHLQFAHAAALFGLGYVQVHGRDSLLEALQGDWLAQPTLLEVVTDNQGDEAKRRGLVSHHRHS